jgi:hypothetical protein
MSTKIQKYKLARERLGKERKVWKLGNEIKEKYGRSCSQLNCRSDQEHL